MIIADNHVIVNNVRMIISLHLGERKGRKRFKTQENLLFFRLPGLRVFSPGVRGF